MKEAVFHPAVRKIVQTFPREVRKELGKLIFGLQLGAQFTAPVSKPIPSVGKGVEELRIKDASGAYRVFYFAKIEDRLLVFHVFKKQSQKTPKREIETGRQRLKEIYDEKS